MSIAHSLEIPAIIYQTTRRQKPKHRNHFQVPT